MQQAFIVNSLIHPVRRINAAIQARIIVLLKILSKILNVLKNVLYSNSKHLSDNRFLRYERRFKD